MRFKSCSRSPSWSAPKIAQSLFVALCLLVGLAYVEAAKNSLCLDCETHDVILRTDVQHVADEVDRTLEEFCLELPQDLSDQCREETAAHQREIHEMMNQLTSRSTCAYVFNCDGRNTFEKEFAENPTFFKGRLCFVCKIALMVATEDIRPSPDVKELIEATLEMYCQRSAAEDRDKCYKRVEQFRKTVLDPTVTDYCVWFNFCEPDNGIPLT